MYLLQKMEAELNSIHQENIRVMNDTSIKLSERVELLENLDQKQITLRRLINQYVSIQNQFLELTGKLSIY